MRAVTLYDHTKPLRALNTVNIRKVHPPLECPSLKTPLKNPPPPPPPPPVSYFQNPPSPPDSHTETNVRRMRRRRTRWRRGEKPNLCHTLYDSMTSSLVIKAISPLLSLTFRTSLTLKTPLKTIFLPPPPGLPKSCHRVRGNSIFRWSSAFAGRCGHATVSTAAHLQA